jgi:hypothetical protein
MSRPARRTSTIGTGSAVAPDAQDTTPAAELGEAKAGLETSPAPAAAPAKKAAAKKAAPVAEAPVDKPKPTKVSFYQDRDEQKQMRAAWSYTLGQEKHGSLSAFIATAVREKVERLQDQYNNGKPWDGVDAGEIPAGRPSLQD